MKNSLLAHYRHALETYIDAKDNTKPARIHEAFAPEAVLTFSLATQNIAFPSRSVGVKAIAKTLVGDFGLRYSHCRTYYLCASEALVAHERVIDALPWLVVMREAAAGALRIGHGTYRWTFDANDAAPRVVQFHIRIARMDVIDDPDGALLTRLQDGLSYPWLAPGDLAARYGALADDASGSFAFAREFAQPAR
ncbi:hypothetical protein [Paraburkholderia lycopersici]|uniref:SnoaL-like domain-containing protein n=1 Tax=Paraburkholderia lycopersici TaxID=416944 RepID=A0A1G6U8I4_9BURK|nr:hypothetical protein [Paraburkholderia lycopersici]SDD37702.1 hypothetical protein SAMN05421548_118113 [Paraburkholderia lycopersici]